MAPLVTGCWLLLVLPLVSGAPAEGQGQARAAGLELLLLHTNDMHARYEEINRYTSRCADKDVAAGACFGGYARVATMLRRAREDAAAGGLPVLTLNAGDTYQGTIYYNLFKWEMAAKFTNLLNFDVMSLGNHEFDDGDEGLIPFLKNVTSPNVAANLDLSSAPELEPLVKRSVVLDVRGVKVGVIGYLTPETRFLANPSNKVKFLDEIQVLSAEAARLKREGVNIIIGLGHSGYIVDQQIAAKVPDIDLVVGGHSHSFLYTGKPPDIDNPVGLYPTFVSQPSGRRVPVVQAYAFTKYMGRLKIRFNADGEIASPADVEGLPVLLDNSIVQDPEVLEELSIWKSKLNDRVMQPVGSSLVLLDNTACRRVECNVGNLVADAKILYRATRYKGPGWTDAPIAFENGGNIRTTVDARSNNGTVTLRDVMEIVPFENHLVLVRLNGTVLLQTLEHSVSSHSASGENFHGCFLHFSGLYVTFDLSAPVGQRVVSARARCGNCSVPFYSPVKEDEVYSILVNDFLLQGGDGFSMLKNYVSATVLDDVAYTALAEYFRAKSPVYPAIEGRIKFVSRPTTSGSGSRSHILASSTLHLPSLIVLYLFSWIL